VSLTLAPLATDRGEATTRRRAIGVDLAIVLSFAAALAHLVAAPSHFTWWPASGVFFVALGAGQLAYSVLLWRGVHATWLLVAGVWGTVAVILLYVASRTIGLPMTPPVPFHGGRWVPGRSMIPNGAKYVGPLDVFTVVSEVLLVVTLLGMLPSSVKARTVNRLMWVGLALWGAGAIAVLG
jgi:hypothetical protein